MHMISMAIKAKAKVYSAGPPDKIGEAQGMETGEERYYSALSARKEGRVPEE